MQVGQAVQCHVTSDGNDKWINTTVERVDCGIVKGMQTAKVKCRAAPVTVDKLRLKPGALDAAQPETAAGATRMAETKGGRDGDGGAPSGDRGGRGDGDGGDEGGRDGGGGSGARRPA